MQTSSSPRKTSTTSASTHERFAMTILSHPAPLLPQDSALQLPATKRISTPSSQRLSAITEDPNRLPPQTPKPPPKNPLRNSAPDSVSPVATSTPSRHSARRVSRFSEDTRSSAPPSYDWVPDSLTDVVPNPADDEKLAELRRGAAGNQRRGGWWRLAAIIVVVAIIAIALGVGLGVGLTRRKDSNVQSSQPSTSPFSNGPSDSSQQFPMGEYSIPITLSSVQTNCTSNPATWRCYPYSVGENITLAWTITNTSSNFASNQTTSKTSSDGVPANLTISASDNPFSITFSNQSMTYISPSHSQPARLLFEFTMNKAVYPSSPITTDGQNAECFFNSTNFMGTMYLGHSTTLPNSNNSTSGGTQPLWPYDINVNQSTAGGPNVPNCYETGTGVSVDVAAVPDSQACTCEYSNY